MKHKIRPKQELLLEDPEVFRGQTHFDTDLIMPESKVLSHVNLNEDDVPGNQN